ncbi:MAG TPA: hypothetical protein VIJ43_04485 [Burkholderiales bacterium]
MRPRPLRSGAGARDQALEMIEREALASPAFSYRILPVQTVLGDAIGVGEAVLDAPALAAATAELNAVAAAACTLGPAVQERISALFATRRRSLALALDTLANELLFRLADRAFATIRREARRTGLGIGIEASPGDPGVPLAQQAGVLALADAARIGIHAVGAGMLSPMKSLSFVVALGPNLRRHSAPGRCNCCPSRDRCTVK